MSAPPVALIVAGFDTSSGAGLQADLQTLSNHGFHSLTAATTLVAETPLSVRSVHPVSPNTLRDQLQILVETYPIAVVKIGLIANRNQVTLIAETLASLAVPIILDPVGTASTGTRLQEGGTVQALRAELAPQATVMTPNLIEAQSLLEDFTLSPEATAKTLHETIGASVLLTGGHHVEDRTVTDYLVHDGEASSFSDSEITTPASLHGTGCVLSSALAAGLGQGRDLQEAVGQARRYLRRSLEHHHRFAHSEPLLALNHLCHQDEQ